ncbi:hypothetical protein Vadar_025259 [Vaccinium darrowii]|uniref:Uncharacterized protein n=1 Tax=Vaccinium darrowii TaxID=229202 RepID=A0ACB7XCR1_9ERIC|nr:hypothetical protein Vadar_025259 [Vaccinium darrowii]
MADENGLDGGENMQEVTASTSLGLETEQKKSKKEDSGKTVRFHKLFSFADSVDALLMMIGTICAVGNGLCMPFMAILVGEVLNSFGQNQNNKDIVRIVSKFFVVIGGNEKFDDYLLYYVLGVIEIRLFSFVRGVAAFLQVSCWMVTGEQQTARIRTLYLKSIMRQDIAFFDTKTNTGEVVGRMSTDTILIQDAMGEKVGKFMQLVSTFLGGFVIAFVKGWLLTLVLISSIPPLVLAGAAAAVFISKAAFNGQNAYAKSAIVVEQTIGSIRTVASFTGEKQVVIKYNKSLVDAYKTDNGYTGGDVFNVIIAALIGSLSLGQASPCITAFAAGQEAAFKMFETINREPEIDAYDIKGIKLDAIRGDIELRDIYFSYPARLDEQILSGLKEFQLKWVREKIGLVSQEPVLFTCSIKDTIAYAKDKATLEEISAAARLANAAIFIDKLPQGLDTLVGEHGTQLSGGQKQRVAIARAILKDPQILVLDEATSVLDVESQTIVQEALDRIMVNRTTIIVAHHLSIVRNADIIAVIHRGKIIEKGSHSTLLEDPKGEYSQLIRLQEVNKDSEQDTVGLEKSKSVIEVGRQSSQRYKDSEQATVGLGNRSLSWVSHSHSSENASKVPLRQLAHLNKPEAPMLIAGAIAAVISGSILPIFSLFIANMIKTFFEPPHQLKKDSKFWALMFVVLGATSLFAYPLRAYLFSMAGCKLTNRVRSMCFEKVVRMEVSWFDEPENSSGVIGARLSTDAAPIRALVGDALALLVQTLLQELEDW